MFPAWGWRMFHVVFHMLRVMDDLIVDHLEKEKPLHWLIFAISKAYIFGMIETTKKVVKYISTRYFWSTFLWISCNNNYLLLKSKTLKPVFPKTQDFHYCMQKTNWYEHIKRFSTLIKIQAPYLWFGEFKDDQGTSQYKRQKPQCQSLPRFQRYER